MSSDARSAGSEQTIQAEFGENRSGREASFVGRAGELRKLQATFDAAATGRGALIMLVGEPGIGKTALCEQLASFVGTRCGLALVGHCYPDSSASVPHLPFVEAFESYARAAHRPSKHAAGSAIGPTLPWPS